MADEDRNEELSLTHKRSTISLREYQRGALTDFGAELASDISDAMIIAAQGIQNERPAHALWGPLAAEVFKEIRQRRKEVSDGDG